VKRGRKTKFRRKYVPIILEMARKGCTDSEIARAINIGKSTFSDWLKRYPDLAEQLAEAREVPIREVEGNFYKRANGFMVQVRKIKIDPTDPKHEKIQEITVEDKYFPPSVPAGLIILTNRFPNEYKVRQTHEITGQVGIKAYIGVSPDEWDAIDVEGKKALPGGNGGGNETQSQ